MKVAELFEVKERSVLSVMGKQPDHYKSGDFLCANKKLTSLKGAPLITDGNFYCSDNKLTSLEGAPSTVGGDFFCYENNLTSLKGAPSSVNSFYCYNNHLTSLKGAPSSVNSFYCYNNHLTSLKGAPTSVSGEFSCSNNDLTSLEGAPTSVGSHFYCYNNNLTSLHNIHKQIKHIGGEAKFGLNELNSHILGLLLIDGLIDVDLDNKKVQKIINKHLEGDRDIFACQEELIENGFEEFAKL